MSKLLGTSPLLQTSRCHIEFVFIFVLFLPDILAQTNMTTSSKTTQMSAKLGEAFK